MRMRALLLDDERNALEVLEFHLVNHYSDQIEIIGSYTDSREGIEKIKELKPQVVFLDIEMPFHNGFEVIQATNHLPIQFVFTTAYDQFAIKAFKVNAVDYLLKPIDLTDLDLTVQKLIANKITSGSALLEKLQSFSLEDASTNKSKIGLSIGDSLQFFHPDEIVRFESDSNYTHIFLLNGKKITCSKTLKDIEDKLVGIHFFRAHNSHLINMKHIEKYMKGNAGFILMKDQALVALSRSKKDEFLNKFWNL